MAISMTVQKRCWKDLEDEDSYTDEDVQSNTDSEIWLLNTKKLYTIHRHVFLH